VWRDASAASWSKSGTAALVGPRVVVTASHLLPFGAPAGASKVLFVPGYFDGASVAGPGAASWVTEAVGYTFEPDDQAFDMAVLRLNEPVGDWLGYMGARTYLSGWEDKPVWEMVGYPGDVAMAQRPSFEVGISVLDDDSDGDFLEIEHHGDSSDGNSGGPLFSFWPNGPYVIGVLSGLERRTGPDAEDANVSAGGKGMVDLVRWARDTWT
jgi:V8-like Glu-specific endopeptidase